MARCRTRAIGMNSAIDQTIATHPIQILGNCETIRQGIRNAVPIHIQRSGSDGFQISGDGCGGRAGGLRADQ